MPYKIKPGQESLPVEKRKVEVTTLKEHTDNYTVEDLDGIIQRLTAQYEVLGEEISEWQTKRSEVLKEAEKA